MTASSPPSGTQSPSNVRGAVAQLYLTLDGQTPPPELMQALQEVVVDSSLTLPDSATVTFRDASIDLIDSDRLKLGAKLEVKAAVQRGGEQEAIFRGEIVEVEPQFEGHTQTLTVRAFDRLHRLARGTQTRSFQNVTDMDLVRKIASELGLKAEVGEARAVHEYVLQHNQSNLAFLRGRAARLGFVLYVEGDTLHCHAPKGEGSLELRWRENLSSFLPRLSSLDQTSRTTVRGWDPQKKQAVVAQAERGQGQAQVQDPTRSEQVSQNAFNLPAPETQSGTVVRQQGYADAMAQASRNRRAEGLVEATGTCGGTPRLTAGTTIKITGVGTRFEGEYVTSSVRHRYRTQQGYQTEFTISGGREEGVAAMLGGASTAAGAAGGGSAASSQTGFMIGIVTNNDDPQGQGRVKVKFPALTEKDESDWARVVSVGGGPTRGVMFTPEVNDEVLVGFEQGDIHFPYVLGGLWNGSDAPPKAKGEVIKSGRVTKRIIRSRLGHEIILDDSDGSPSILLKDKSGNEVLIDSKANLIKISSKGRVEISAQSGVKIDGGGGNVDVKGTLINLN